MILVRSPVRFAAMAEQVRGDIEVMCRSCEKVIVLAHSQGSAVSWHAIRRTAEEDPATRANVDLFFSFGQAFRKLKSLYLVQTAPGLRKLTFLGLATLSTILLLVAGYNGAGILGQLISDDFSLDVLLKHRNFPWFAGALIGVVVVQEFLVRLANQNDAKGEEEIQNEIKDVQAAMPGFRWFDLWASADPAPNGPLLTNLPKGVESYKIRNIGSTILDHSIYWRNRTVFVSAVAFSAASLAPPSPMGIREPIPEELKKAACVRGRRVTMLLVGRILFFAALAISLWGARESLPDWGKATLRWVDSLPLPDWFAGWPWFVNGFVAGALVAAIGFVLWLITGKVWDIVIAADEAAFHGGRDAVQWSTLSIIWMIGAIAWPTAVLAGLSIYLDNWSVLLAYLVISAVAVPAAVYQPLGWRNHARRRPRAAGRLGRSSAAILTQPNHATSPHRGRPLRALLSVSDREGIVELARGLTEAGIECFATDGTRAHLAEAGIEVKPVTDLTDSPEILGGRVKTLHPKIFAGAPGAPRPAGPPGAAGRARDRADRPGGRQPLPVRRDGARERHDAGPGAREDRHRRRRPPPSRGQELPGRRGSERSRPSTHRSCATSSRRARSAPRPARSWRPRRSP